MGAPVGNKNSSRENRLFTNALRRKAIQNPEVMQAVVDSIYAEAMNGNIQAAKEIFDRTDGKAIQQLDIDANITTHEATLDELE